MIPLLDLFSGIGGISLGLERTGAFETVAFCEKDAYCRAVLAKRWPGKPCYDDIRKLTADRLARDGLFPRALAGGFPCQDLSLAGKGAGLAGADSGLWSEYHRLIREIRPDLVLVENVAALLGRGLGVVLGDLAALGYDAEWHCVPAAYVGAPHRRDRIWIVAYPDGHELRQHEQRAARRRLDVQDGGHALARDDGAEGVVADSAGERRAVVEQGGELAGRPALERSGANSDADLCAHSRAEPGSGAAGRGAREAVHVAPLRSALAHADGGRREVERFAEHTEFEGASGSEPDGRCEGRRGYWTADPNAGRERLQGVDESWAAARAAYRSRYGSDPGWWGVEPDVGRVADGIPARVDRLRALGNSVVPQVVEMIGRAMARLDEQP